MPQIEQGIRAILATPTVYNFFQNIMGAKRVRKDFAESYLRLENGQKMLDIGCGTADILNFIPEGIEYYGFDFSKTYIRYAKRVHRGRGQFQCEQVDSLVLQNIPKMDLVLAGGLIHHLDDQETTKLLTTAKQALIKGGRFVAIDPCYEIGQNTIAKWLIDRDRGENVRNQFEYSELAQQSFSQVESFVIHRSWIPYTHHIMVCSA